MSTFLNTQKKVGVIKFLELHHYKIDPSLTAKELIIEFIESNNLEEGIYKEKYFGELYEEFKNTFSYRLFLGQLRDWIFSKGLDCSNIAHHERVKIKRKSKPKDSKKKSTKKSQETEQLSLW